MCRVQSTSDTLHYFECRKFHKAQNALCTLHSALLGHSKLYSVIDSCQILDKVKSRRLFFHTCYLFLVTCYLTTVHVSTSNILRKEVIQPHLPIRLPCYDFTPIIDPTFGCCLLAVGSQTSGVTDSHGVTGGVYKTRERIHRDILIRDY